MSEPRFIVVAHLGRSGGVDRFLVDHHHKGRRGEAHMLWVSGPEAARTGQAMLDAAQVFKSQKHKLVKTVLGWARFSGGWLVLQRASVMLSLNDAAEGGLPEPAITAVGMQTAALMAELERLPGQAGLHRNLSGDTLFLARNGRLRVDTVMAAGGRWPMRTDTATLADPPNASWSLGVLLVELLAGSVGLRQLNAAMQEGRTPATHRSAVKAMLESTRASRGLGAITLDLLDWYADKRTPVEQAGHRLAKLGPDVSALARFADSLPEVAWGWRDDSHPMVGVGTMQRGAQVVSGTAPVEGKAPTRGSGRRLIDSGESTDFVQQEKYAPTPPEVNPLDHFPPAGPESVVTVLESPPETHEAPPPPSARHVPAPLPQQADKPFPIAIVVVALGVAVGAFTIFFFCLMIIVWLLSG